MSKAHLKIIGFILLITSIVETSRSKNQYQGDVALAKRSLLQREHEYFKSQPMSEELRSFIQKYRKKKEDRSKEIDDRRRKRSHGIDESLLYMVQDGQLVPVKTMKAIKRSEREDDEDDLERKMRGLESYTVVPLVIPINMKKPMSKLVKPRTLDEELQITQDKIEKSDKNDKPAVSVSPSLDLSSTSLSSEGQQPSASTTVPEDEEEGNAAANSNATQEETKVLHKILEDVEGLMQWKHEGNKKEGVLCNLNGSWISDAAGMRFDICYKNSTRKKFRIHVADRIPPTEDGFLCDGNWTLFGELPFTHSGMVGYAAFAAENVSFWREMRLMFYGKIIMKGLGMVIALAVHEKDKHIATFIGECRICEGSETVTGTWLIGRSSRDCKDQKASHKILSDVWKREQGHNLRKKHLQQIGFNVKDED